LVPRAFLLAVAESVGVAVGDERVGGVGDFLAVVHAVVIGVGEVGVGEEDDDLLVVRQAVAVGVAGVLDEGGPDGLVGVHADQ
jgi:hypothetical protein